MWSNPVACSLQDTYSLHFERRKTSPKPLQALSSLNSLYLQGRDLVADKKSTYTDLDAAAKHLTCLTLQNCVVSRKSNCACVTSLLELNLTWAALLQVHHHGLAACCCLQVFKCHYSAVIAQYSRADLNFLGNKVPSSLSASTCLTSLSIEFAGMKHETVLDWLTCLTALQHFRAQVKVCQLVLPPCLSCMVNLRTLSVFSVGERAASYIVHAFDWSKLVLLEAVELWGSFECPGHFALMGMVELRKLRMVILASPGFCSIATRQAIHELALLSHRFKQERPDIEYATTPTCESCFDREFFKKGFLELFEV